MKKIRLATIVFILLASITAGAQTVDEIISKHLDSIGGKEKWMAIKSIVTEANMSIQGMEIPIKMYQVHNVGQRINITAMGMENYIIQTPTAGWTYMPVQGQTAAEASPEAVVKETADALDLQGQMLDYATKGHKVELLGKEDVDGTDCFKLKVLMKGGLEQTIFIDSKTYYIIKSINKSKASGQEIEQVQTFSNYKKHDSGLVFPYAMTGFGPGELTISKIEVNIPVDETLFKPSN